MQRRLIITLICLTGRLCAGETIEFLDGTVLTNAQVLYRNPQELFVSYKDHSKTLTRNIPFKTLSERMQQQYNFDAAAAQHFKAGQATREAEQDRIRAEEALRLAREAKQRKSQTPDHAATARKGTGAGKAPAPQTRTDTWQDLQSAHFRIYHKGSPELAARIGPFLEERFKAMTSQLDIITGLDILWYGDHCVKLYLYPTQQELVDTRKLSSWAAGCADYPNRTIHSIEEEATLKNIVSHELGHLLFIELMNKKMTIGWIDEGMAMWLESNEGRPSRQKVLAAAKKDETLLSLEELTSLRNYQALDTARARLFYGESEKLVALLVQASGFTVFRNFSLQIQYDSNFNNAFNIFYSTKFGTVENLKKTWLDSM